jgi:DNA-binding transcriptional LysR family regulator
VMPVGHALANADSIDMADLRHEPFIGTSAEKAKYIEERFRDLSRRLGFTRRIVQEVNQIHAIIGLVGGGLGVALVPQSVSKLKISGVVFKPLRNRNAPDAEMIAIWRANDDSPVVQRFLQIARKVCHKGSGSFKHL